MQDQNHRHISAKAADKCDDVGICSTAIMLTHAQWSKSYFPATDLEKRRIFYD